MHTSALRCLHAALQSADCRVYVSVSCSVMCVPRLPVIIALSVNAIQTSLTWGQRAVTPSVMCACAEKNILGHLNMCRIVSVSLMAQFLLSSEVLTLITWLRLQASTRHYSFPTLNVCVCVCPSRPVNVLHCSVSCVVSGVSQSVFIVLHSNFHFSSSYCFLGLASQSYLIKCIFLQGLKPKPTAYPHVARVEWSHADVFWVM